MKEDLEIFQSDSMELKLEKLNKNKIKNLNKCSELKK